MTQPLRVGIKLSQDAPIESYKAIWKIADEARFDHCWAMDHLATIGPIGDDRPIFDGWELLAGMAMATSHVRIGLLVTGITYRNPALLAKIATTVDHLSDGRLEFGIGAAWAANEHEMYGISGLDHRVGLFSEGLQVIRSLWTQERTNFDGRYFTMRNAVANPKPVQKPYPPIWVGSGGPTMLKLTARHADVWNASGSAGRRSKTRRGRHSSSTRPAQLSAAIPARSAARSRFRPATTPAEIVDRVHGFADAGFTEVIIMMSGGACRPTPTPSSTAAMLGEKVLPELRG